MLKGKAKNDYQREYMRAYRRGKRKTPLDPTVRPVVKEECGEPIEVMYDRHKAEPQPNLEIQVHDEPKEDEVPWYNPRIHGPGTLVKLKRFGKVIETEVRDVDADGNEVYD